MIVDIYRRPENLGYFSYLVVPAGEVIPNEAVNNDWEIEDKKFNLFADDMLEDLTISDLETQIIEKGYAISNVNNKITLGACI